MKLKQLFESEYGNSINLSGKNLTLLPSDLPDKVSSGFYCSTNKLTSLKHCPSEVSGDFYCFHNNLISLEFCPSKVGGDFDCDNNELTSLEHCPSEVGGYFRCSNNNLTSLEYCPSQIGGNFSCHYNNLTSLEYCPSQIGGNFSCSNNDLTSLKDVHKQIKKIDGDFYCYDNPIKSHILGLMAISVGRTISTDFGDGTDVDKILNKWKNQGRKGVLGCQRDLIAAGYKELAQL